MQQYNHAAVQPSSGLVSYFLKDAAEIGDAARVAPRDDEHSSSSHSGHTDADGNATARRASRHERLTMLAAVVSAANLCELSSFSPSRSAPRAPSRRRVS